MLVAAVEVDEANDEEEEVYGQPEARVQKALADPQLPTLVERCEHERSGHNPYRSWCRICVEAAGREDAHKTNAKDVAGEDKVPTMSFDYDFYGTGARRREGNIPGKDEVTGLVMKDLRSGAVWAHRALCKGPKDTWLMRRMVTNIESAGHAHVRLKADGEPSTKAVQKDIISRRPPPRQTVPTNPPDYDPMANGGAESGVRDVNVQLRKLKLGLEAKIKTEIPTHHALVDWMFEHSAFLITRVPIHRDGKTCHEKLTGRPWRGKLVEFGEQVWAKMVKPKSRSKLATKVQAKFIRATWVGITERTGEHRVVSRSGKAFRVRTIRRVPVEKRWHKDVLMAVAATPRVPDPSKPENPEDVELKNAADMHEELAPEVAEDLPEDLTKSEVEPVRSSNVREMRITKRILIKFGTTEGCVGCTATMNELPTRKHSDRCRERIYKAVACDDDERHMLEKAMDRMLARGGQEGAAQATKEKDLNEKDDILQQEKLSEESHRPEDPGAASSKDGQAMAPEPAYEPTEPEDDQEDASEADEVPRGINENLEEVDDLDDEDDLDDLGEKAGEGEAHDRDHRADTGPAVIEPRKRNDESNEDPDEKPAKKLRIASVHQAIGHISMKKIIEELESDPRLKLKNGNRRQRRTAKQAIARGVVSEVYSPPRIAETAQRMGLTAGMSLDLSTCDENGVPWDFSKKERQDEARRRLREEEPALLVACPMCGPFSSWMAINYQRMDEQEVRQKLMEALQHFKFALELCQEQHQRGGLFLFEHPVAATSWGSRMMETILKIPEVESVNFDFCMLGMQSKNAEGKTEPAKKRTRIVTNSKHAAAALRLCQCNGLHSHVRLESGRPKACEEYPRAFSELIVNALKRERSPTPTGSERWSRDSQATSWT